jgi:uncharacterized protein involved in type VI secretion and phage assembly
LEEIILGLFDIIDEIAEKQITKTETGDSRIFGVMTGIVAKNYDADMPGRVCVTIPVRDAEANELQWARIAMPSSGSKWGYYFLPEVGDQVLLAFEQGNIEKPYVIGCIPKDSNQFLTRSVDEKNQYKKIVTKNGNTILFEDNQEGDGDKDKIEIHTANEMYQIKLDNERQRISIQDKDGKNAIIIKAEDGNMQIKAEKKVTIEVGSNVKLSLNGESGGVQLECSKFTVKADNSVNMESSGSLKINGSNVKVEASSMLSMESSGAAMLSGSPLKMG